MFRRLLLLLLPVVLACGLSAFDLTLQNGTSHFIYDAHVEFDGFRSVGGVFASGAAKTHMGVKRSVPPAVTVVWRDVDGKTFSRQVQIPPKYRSATEIVVRINDDSTITISDQEL